MKAQQEQKAQDKIDAPKLSRQHTHEDDLKAIL